MDPVTSGGLLPRARRGAALALVALGAAGVAAMGFRYRGGDGPGRVDALLDPALAATSPTALQVWSFVVVLGSPLVSGALIAVLAIWAAALRRWSVAALAVLGPGCAALLAEFAIKPLVGRLSDGDLAFPSGHTVRAVALATVVILVLLRASGPGRWRAAGMVVAGGLSLAVALSLVALQWHYTTDTIGGALLSVAVVLAVSLGIDLVGDLVGNLRGAPPG
ncbi:phosphatase PAP2 family protein [Actinomycetospora sp. CA-101289]|uniref:phosphatase PAP2 family protein n=1 Tax=Actinomycetospora sp. CA-101289 TaxID=3239893 RepID=UPI003D95F98D